MGVSNTPGELIGKFRALANVVESSTETSVRAAAKIAQETIEAERATAGAGSGRLRGVGKKGAAIGLKVTVSGDHAEVAATGPWQLLESDTKAHMIPRMALKGAKGRSSHRPGRKLRNALYGPAFGGLKANTVHPVNIPGVGWRPQAFHPGTHGKHPFVKGVATAIPIMPEPFEKALRGGLLTIFGGS